jgi:hypothetical protein
MIALLQVVRVVRDVSPQIKKGMIGTVIALFDEPVRAYEVEVVDAEGRTIVQATLAEHDLEVVNTEVAGPA